MTSTMINLDRHPDGSHRDEDWRGPGTSLGKNPSQNQTFHDCGPACLSGRCCPCARRAREVQPGNVGRHVCVLRQGIQLDSESVCAAVPFPFVWATAPFITVGEITFTPDGEGDGFYWIRIGSLNGWLDPIPVHVTITEMNED